VFSVGPEGWAQQGGSWKNPGFAQGPSHPVVGISWNDAKAFCQWLTQTERDRGLIASNEYYRLPTDWEWGMAVGLRQRKEGAPSEKNGKISSLYPWGTQWPPPKGAGNYAGTEVLRTPWPASWGLITNFNDGYPRTSPVGTFAANRFGLYDMGGNAWQWCEDFYNGVRGPRVLRGASWSDRENEAFTSCRRFDRPESRVCNYGFRVVLAKSPL
jgi:formylglycine-generating enzyme required for sulfatase activity